MIITGDDVLWKPVPERRAHLAQITGLMRHLRTGAVPLTVGALAAANASGVVACYLVDDTIVGCGQFVISPHLAMGTMPEIQNVAVEPSCRRRGIARAICLYLINEARRRKVWRVALLTEMENAAACALYQSLGFERIDRPRFRLNL